MDERKVQDEHPAQADETLSFRIIASAGQCRSLAFTALEHAKRGEFDQANDLLGEARDASLAAHNEQTDLLVREAQGSHTVVDMMMVHAQDHLMTAMLAYELIDQMIQMYKAS